MAKKRHHYHFNPKLLRFEKVRITLKQRIIKFLSYVAMVVVFSSVVLLIAYNFFSSPKEKMLKREIEQYKLQYTILNDKIEKISTVLSDLENRDDNIYRVIFEAEPIPSTMRKASFGGTDRYAKLEGYDNSELIIETSKKIDQLSRQAYVQSKSFDDVFKMAMNKNLMFASIPAIQPTTRASERVISGFGLRIHPIYKTLLPHTGIDITSPIGTPVYATGDGEIEKPFDHYTGYGTLCMINHGYGYQTLYAHLSKVVVRYGQKVKRGQLIGYTGNSGVSAGPHLHYEVIKNGKKINPINYFYNDLTPEEYEKLIEISSKVNQALS